MSSISTFPHHDFWTAIFDILLVCPKDKGWTKMYGSYCKKPNGEKAPGCQPDNICMDEKKWTWSANEDCKY